MGKIPASEIKRRFEGAGLKYTLQRRTIYQAIAEAPDYQTPAKLQEQLARYGIGLSTIYRTLEVLTQLGLIRHVHVGEEHYGYAAVSPGHSHQLICHHCGRVVEFADCPLEELLAKLAKRKQFQIEGHRLEVYGACAACRRAKLSARRQPELVAPVVAKPPE